MNNECAFPKATAFEQYPNGENSKRVIYSTGGLTKRELFAAMFLIGPLSFKTKLDTPENESLTAIKYADAMLAMLEKTNA